MALIRVSNWGMEPPRNLPTKNEDGWFEFTYATSDFAAGDIPGEGVTTPDLIFALSQDGQPLEKFQIYRLPDGKEVTEETLVSDDDLILGIQARKVEEVRIVIAGGEPKRRTVGIRAADPGYRAAAAGTGPGRRGCCPARSPGGRGGAALRRRKASRHFVCGARDRVRPDADPGACRRVPAGADPVSKPALPASVFYGLARTRAASDVLALARLSTDDSAPGTKAGHCGTIRRSFHPLTRRTVLMRPCRVIRDVLASYLPSYRPAEGVPSLADLMGADLPNSDDQATLWRTYSDHEGTPAEFWEKLKSQPGFEDPNKIRQSTVQLSIGPVGAEQYHAGERHSRQAPGCGQYR